MQMHSFVCEIKKKVEIQELKVDQENRGRMQFIIRDTLERVLSEGKTVETSP